MYESEKRLVPHALMMPNVGLKEDTLCQMEFYIVTSPKMRMNLNWLYPTRLSREYWQSIMMLPLLATLV
ncbi:hypothetical protein NQ314_010674 [Rhamnusium bicolor]|uniref:Uncharacterized protein n=1 Tax=Rhamnusium bicolor TaxID=1586634 RepID=A0AAV8XQ67_9CUCU|nr:hypothetical protein NQ314_010674 [Rhamnusium bicolor]